MRMREESVKKVRLFGFWGIIEWICEESLWEFVSDLMVMKEF